MIRAARLDLPCRPKPWISTPACSGRRNSWRIVWNLAAPADEFEAAGDLDAAAAGLEDVLAPEIGVGGTARASASSERPAAARAEGTAAPDANAPQLPQAAGLGDKKRATAQAASAKFRARPPAGRIRRQRRWRRCH